MSEKHPISLWDESAEEATYESLFEGDTTTEVAIIGGGFTGLSTALHTAERGIDCHVLEARHIGYGGSGRNVGLLNAGLWLPPQNIRAKLGDTYGTRLVNTLSDAPDTAFGLIEKHQIRCEATRQGTIHAAHSPKGFDDLARRAEEWQRLGAPVDLLSREETADKIGSPVFHGGLLDHRAGTINPMGYVRGLARAARGAGANISTGVTAQKLRRDGDRWCVETDQGTVMAKTVILGTNAYSDELWPGLKKTFTMIHYFQLATVPLGERTASILPGRQGLWDTAPIMFSLRRDAFGRLIVGSMGRVMGGGLSHRWASRMLRRIFPHLGPVEIETAWHGQIAMTSDHLPRIHRLAEGLYTPIGYNGRGIGPGTVFGKAMAMLIAGGDESDLPMPITDMKSAAAAPVMSRAYDLAFITNQFIKGF